MASDEDRDFESDPEEEVEEEVEPEEKAQGEEEEEEIEEEEEVEEEIEEDEEVEEEPEEVVEEEEMETEKAEVEKDKVENMEEKEEKGMKKEVELEEEMEAKEEEEEQMEVEEEEAEELVKEDVEEEEEEVEDEVKEDIQMKNGARLREKEDSAEENQDHNDEGRAEDSGVAKHVLSRRAEPFAEMETSTTASKAASNDDIESHAVHQHQLNSSHPINVNTITSLDAGDKRLATKNAIEGGPKNKRPTGPVEDESSSLQPQANIHPSSMFVPQKRPRSPSPDAVLENTGKQGPVMCTFFAKGWCIKGKSCTFLHQKVGESSNQGTQDNLPWPSGTGVFQHDTGLRQERELLKPQAPQEVRHSPNIEGSSDCQMLKQRALIWKYGGKGSEQDNSLGPSDELLKEKFAAGDQASNPPLARSTLISENRYLPIGPSTFSSLHQNSSSHFAYDRTAVDCARQNHWNHFAHHESVTSYGLNSSLDGSFTSPLPPACVLPSVQFKADAWETSVPFRSKVCPLPSSASPPINHYNPFLDSLDDPTVGSATSQSSHRASFPRFSGQNINNELMPTGLQNPANCTQKPSNYLPQHHEDVSAKDASVNESSGYAVAASVNGPNIIDGRSSCTRKEEKHQVPNHVLADGNAVEYGTNNTANEVEQEVTFNESRLMKSFRAALVEFVKELVKPAWREGHLTKNAHKTVVKKSVEKVLGTLQPHQIPITQDDLNHFLSVSRQKLEKLVNAYVDRHKTIPGSIA